MLYWYHSTDMCCCAAVMHTYICCTYAAALLGCTAVLALLYMCACVLLWLCCRLRCCTCTASARCSCRTAALELYYCAVSLCAALRVLRAAHLLCAHVHMHFAARSAKLRTAVHMCCACCKCLSKNICCRYMFTCCCTFTSRMQSAVAPAALPASCCCTCT